MLPKIAQQAVRCQNKCGGFDQRCHFFSLWGKQNVYGLFLVFSIEDVLQFNCLTQGRHGTSVISFLFSLAKEINHYLKLVYVLLLIKPRRVWSSMLHVKVE